MLPADGGSVIEVSKEVRQAVEIFATRQPLDDVPAAIKTLREFSGFNQEQIAKRFCRTRSSVSNWETGQKLPPIGMTKALLEAFLIPQEIIEEYVKGDLAIRLDSDSYRRFDPIELDHEFFLATRGEVLQDVYIRAKSGSFFHAKLYKDWMDQTDRAIAARISSAISVSEHAESLRHRAIQATNGIKRNANEPQAVVDNEQRPDHTTASDVESTIPNPDRLS